MKPAQALAYFRQLSCLGLDSRLVIPGMMAALHDIIPSTHNFFFWTTPDGSPVNIFAEEIIASVFSTYAEAGPLLAGPEEPNIQRLATSPHRVGRMHEAFSPRLIDRSRTREIVLEPYRVAGPSLMASVRERGGAVLGLMTLGRSTGERDFSEAEVRLLEGLTVYVLHALKAEPSTAGQMWIDGQDTAAVLADEEGRIRHTTSEARTMLAYAAEPGMRPGASLKPFDPYLPRPLRELCRNLDAIGRGLGAPPPAVVLEGPWGQLHCRAQRTTPAAGEGEGEHGVLVTLVRRRPLPLHLAHRLQRMPLSPRQREVALMLGLGRSPEEITDSLGIRRNTYRAHLADIYDRMGVANRSHFMAGLLGG